jgi:hypothetical protein
MPYAVPTPYLSPSQGGNSTIRSNSQTQSVPSYAQPIQSSVGGGVRYDTGVVVPSYNVQLPNQVQPKQNVSRVVQNQNLGANMTNLGGTPNGASSPVPVGTPTPQPQQQNPSQPSEPDINAQLNDIYNQGMGYLGEQEQSLNNQYGDIQNQYTQPIDALRPGVDLARQNQSMSNQYQTQNAIDAAIRLYNEMNTRSRQMFGGSNSAGEFSNQFYGRENQRQMGNIQNQSGQNQYNIEDTYQKNLKELENQKAQAIVTAKQDFQSRMDKINTMKFQFAQDKAAARLGELQNYRARVQNIQDQANAFQQSQQQMILQSKLNMGQNVANTSIGQVNPQYSALNQGTNQYNTSPLTGQVDFSNIRKQYGF